MYLCLTPNRRSQCSSVDNSSVCAAHCRNPGVHHRSADVAAARDAGRTLNNHPGGGRVPRTGSQEEDLKPEQPRHRGRDGAESKRSKGLSLCAAWEIKPQSDEKNGQMRVDAAILRNLNCRKKRKSFLETVSMSVLFVLRPDQ